MTIHKLIAALLIGLYVSLLVPLQAQICYEIRMNTPILDDKFNLVVVDSTGNAFTDFSYHLTNYNINKSISYLYKISPIGDTLRYDFQSQDSIYGFSPYMDSDGNILLNGYCRKIESIGFLGEAFQRYVKLDSCLEVLWEKDLYFEADSISSYGYVIDESPWNTYIRAELIHEGNDGIWKLTTLELSKDGDSLNEVSIYNSEHIGIPYSITSSPSEPFQIEYQITLPITPLWGDSAACGRIILNNSFNVISQKAYPIGLYRDPFFTMKLNNYYYISAGSHGLGSNYIQVRKMDIALNLIDSINLCYSNNETVPAWRKCLDFIDPNRIFIVGMTPYYSEYQVNYIYVACLDSNLNLIHEEYFGGDGHYDIYSCAASPDGGVILAGVYIDTAQEPLQSDGYIIKLDSSLFVGVAEFTLPSEKLTLEITPNPVQNLLNIKSSVENYLFELYDLNGKICYRKVLHIYKGKERPHNKEQINIKNLSPGLYLWKASLGNSMNSGKLILF